MSTDAFTAEVRESVLVAEMHETRPADREAVNERLMRLVSRDAVTGFVAVDDTEGPVPPERFEDIERMSEFAARSGVERVALVGEGVKAIAIEGTADHPDLAVQRFADRAEAIEWARAGSGGGDPTVG